MNISEEKVKETVSVIVKLLMDLVDSAQPEAPKAPEAKPLDQWMTRQEYAAHRKVSAATVYRWLIRGLPSFKQGGLTRIEVAKADAWIAAGGLGSRKVRSKREGKGTNQ